MTRARIALAATLAAALAAGTAHAQAQGTSVLAGRKIVPPVKGEALIEYTAPATKRQGASVVTTIMVKNLSQAPIARLRIAETWYGKDSSIVIGGQGAINGLLQPNEVGTIVIETPWNEKMFQSQYTFSHANGKVSKPRRVAKLEAPKEPATVPAAAPKK